MLKLWPMELRGLPRASYFREVVEKSTVFVDEDACRALFFRTYRCSIWVQRYERLHNMRQSDRIVRPTMSVLRTTAIGRLPCVAGNPEADNRDN